MKKIIYTAVITSLAAVPQLYANGMPAQPNEVAPPTPVMKALTGFTLGAQFGLASAGSKLKEKDLIVTNRSSSTDLNGRGIIGGANIGYGMLWNQIYAGLEASYNFTDLDGKKQTITVAGVSHLNHKVELKNTWDVSARLGYLITDRVFPYIKAGVAVGDWKAQTARHPNLGQGSKTKSTTGFIVGIGGEYQLAERVALGLEYTYASYGKVSHDIRNDFGQSLRRITATPTVNTFMLKARYKIF